MRVGWLGYSKSQKRPIQWLAYRALLWSTLALLSLTLIGLRQAHGEPLEPVWAKPFNLLQVQGLKESFRRPFKEPITVEEIPFPSESPYTPESAKLGEALFFDTRLSESGVFSCASCHNPATGWEAPVDLVLGNRGEPLRRHTPTLLNAAWTDRFLWDGSTLSLEEQMLGPLTDPNEMANPDLTGLVERLGPLPVPVGISVKSDTYAELFAETFDDGLTLGNLQRALATYQRTLIAPQSTFDRWVEGEDNAISDEAKRGFVLFNTKARCAACHAGWTFSDGRFHDTGLPSDDLGRGAVRPDLLKAQFAFKTPSLRQIGVRSPFMHDGSLPNMESVLEHYRSGGINRPSLSPLMLPLDLGADDMNAMSAFLATLTVQHESDARACREGEAWTTCD